MPDQFIPTITTHSIEEGLDFGCNLASSVITFMQPTPELALELLKSISSYISFRYAGELGLALEDLIWIGDAIDHKDWSSRLLFWNQLEWVSKQMKMNEFDFETRRKKH